MSTHQKLLWILVVVLTICMGAVAIDLYRVQTHQNDALDNLLCHAESIVRSTPVSVQFTLKDKQKALRFYQSNIRDNHLKPCKEGN